MAEGDGRNESPVETVGREMRVLIEGVHDRIQLLAEATANQNETVVRRLDNLETRFDTLETRFDTLETRFDTLETRFDRLETQFDTLETRFDNVDTRSDKLQTSFDQLRRENLSQHKTLLRVLSDHESRVAALERGQKDR